MDRLLNNKLHPAFVGLLQALAVVVYSAKVAALLFFMSSTKIQPGYVGMVFMLVLFVFSAGITGTFVFGLPVYYALKNDIKRAISILGYTFFYLLMAIFLATVLIVAVT